MPIFKFAPLLPQDGRQATSAGWERENRSFSSSFIFSSLRPPYLGKPGEGREWKIGEELRGSGASEWSKHRNWHGEGGGHLYQKATRFMAQHLNWLQFGSRKSTCTSHFAEKKSMTIVFCPRRTDHKSRRIIRLPDFYLVRALLLDWLGSYRSTAGSPSKLKAIHDFTICCRQSCCAFFLFIISPLLKNHDPNPQPTHVHVTSGRMSPPLINKDYARKKSQTIAPPAANKKSPTTKRQFFATLITWLIPRHKTDAMQIWRERRITIRHKFWRNKKERIFSARKKRNLMASDDFLVVLTRAATAAVFRIHHPYRRCQNATPKRDEG